jgi:integral membrane protein (TIGR01906 family)
MKRITAFAIALTVIIISVKFTLNFKPLYYFDIDHLSITSNTTLSRDEIVTAYDYLIYYIDSSREMNFSIPNLPSSPQGSIHFQEVRAIFKKLDLLLCLCAAASAFGIYSCIKKREFSFLKLSSNFILIISASAILFFSVNFDQAFTLFHKLLFSNNYWLFDPATDPVINLLPEEFFFHCLLLIAACIGASALLLRLAYRKLRS